MTKMVKNGKNDQKWSKMVKMTKMVKNGKNYENGQIWKK